MLILAGLGLCNEKDITLREIDEARDADRIFIETYTSKWMGSIERLKKILGKEIERIGRKDLEENSKWLIELSRKEKIIIFVPGDPLVATTHISLVSQCLKEGINVKIIHNSSVVSALAESGLHIYKFGPIVTIPSREKFSTPPKYIYEIIRSNKERGLHTLCLLDVDLGIKEALQILKECEIEYEKFLPERLIVVSRLGCEDSKIYFGSIEKLEKKEIDSPAVIIIPGSLHFTEIEYLENFSI